MSDRWTMTTGSALPDSPATKLQTDLLSDYWSSYNHRASNSWIQAQSDTATSSARRLWLIGLLGMNRRLPTALVQGVSYAANTVRVRVDSYPLADRIRPVLALSSKVNLTGADALLTGHPINPPDDPAPTGYVETKLTPTSSASATSLIATTTNHYATERALTGNVTIRFHLRDVNEPTKIPNLVLAIYQSGSPVSVTMTTSYERVTVTTSSGGFIIDNVFPVSELASSTAAVEIRASTAAACDWIGVEVIFNHTGYLYDSGNVDISAQTRPDILVLRPDLTLPAGVVYVHVAPSAFCSFTTASYSKVGGGSADAQTFTSIAAPDDTDGRLHIGRFIASDALVFPIAGIGGYNLQAMTDAQLTRTRSGSLRGRRVGVEWVESDLTVIGISRVLLQRIEQLIRVLGIMNGPTLLVPDPDMTEGFTDEQTAPRWVVIGGKAETHIGRLTGMDEDVDADGVNHVRDRWDVGLHLVDHGGVRS